MLAKWLIAVLDLITVMIIAPIGIKIDKMVSEFLVDLSIKLLE